MSEGVNKIGIRLKCLELAVMSNPIFPGKEIHRLADEYEYYVMNGTWPYNKTNDGEAEESKNSEDR